MILELNMARDWAYSKYITKYKSNQEFYGTKEMSDPTKYTDEQKKKCDIDVAEEAAYRLRYLKMDDIYNKKIAHFIDVQIDIWKPVIEQEKK